jgi:hypothetical protein
MTKKQAYKIIEEQYGDYASIGMIYSLCSFLDYELRSDWCDYWHKINEENHAFISSALDKNKHKDVISSLTRLMLLHDFIEDTYK